MMFPHWLRHRKGTPPGPPRQNEGGQAPRRVSRPSPAWCWSCWRSVLITKTNYLTGSDPSAWHTNIPNYGQVAYQGVYPGVNLVYHGNQGQLEYDFVVQPGANPGTVQMRMQGAQGLSRDAQGDLVIKTPGGDLVEQAPVVYQEVNGTRRAVSGRFVLEGDNQVGFRVGSYDPSRPLVIDPTLSYSTYLGGSGGTGAGVAIAVDGSGNAYVTGWTRSSNFPTRNSIQAQHSSGTVNKVLNSDVFVTTLNAAGSGLLFSTYFGGTGEDFGYGIALDAAGNTYVTGGTFSSNFPTTAGALQTAASRAFVFLIDPPADGATTSPATGPTSLATPGGSTSLPAAAPAPIAWALPAVPAQASLPAALGAGRDSLSAAVLGAASSVLGMTPKQPADPMGSASGHHASPVALDQLFADFGPGLFRGFPGNVLAPTYLT